MRRLALPDDTLERVRAVYLGLTFVVIVPFVLQLGTSARPASALIASLVTLGALMAYRIVGYRRGRFPVLGDPLEAASFIVLALAAGDVSQPLPILFLGLNFRAFYGSTRRTALLMLLFTAAYLAAAVVAEGNGDTLASALPLIPTILLNGGFAAFLTRTLRGKTALERGLRLSEARFRTLVENTAEVILVVGQDGAIRFHTASASKLFGVGHAELGGRTLADVVHADDADGALKMLSDPNTSIGDLIDLRVLDAQSAMWLHVEGLVGGMIDGEIAGRVLTLRDVTQQKALELRLRHDAVHDALTQLPNRAELHKTLVTALAGSAVGGTAIGVLLIDLDDFKTVNDTLGHSAGDQLLVKVAHRLRQNVHDDDLVARPGGDEFAVLLRRLSSPDDAKTVAERILVALQPSFVIDGHELFVRASIGIATSDVAQPVCAEDLLRQADTAMYAAKGRGKARVETYEHEMSDVLERRRTVQNELRSAIDEGQLFLEYQPLVRLEGGTLIGAEALVRWRHPTRGVVPPLDFIDLAEQTGLAIPLGRFVVERAIRDIADWRDRGLLTDAQFRMSVNLSASQLLEPELPSFLTGTLAAYGVPASALTLEVTETVLMQDAPAIGERLGELKRIGLSLALDDFGTGYTSLAYLHEFPIDVLKIDRTFVRDLGRDPKKTALARSIIGLSADLGFTTVAEGVETVTQRDLLRAYGAENGQGFLFGRPVVAKEFVRSHLTATDGARLPEAA